MSQDIYDFTGGKISDIEIDDTYRTRKIKITTDIGILTLNAGMHDYDAPEIRVDIVSKEELEEINRQEELKKLKAKERKLNKLKKELLDIEQAKELREQKLKEEIEALEKELK